MSERAHAVEDSEQATVQPVQLETWEQSPQGRRQTDRQSSVTWQVPEGQRTVQSKHTLALCCSMRSELSVRDTGMNAQHVCLAQVTSLIELG